MKPSESANSPPEAAPEFIPTRKSLLTRLKTGVDAGVRKDIQACIDSENNSRAELVKHWDEFAAGDRTLCINAASTGGSATYTELITCLEMLRDTKALKQKEASDSATNGTGIEGRTKSKR